MNNIERLLFEYKGKVNNIGIKKISDIHNEWINKSFTEEPTSKEKELMKRVAYTELLSSDRFKKSKERKENLIFKYFVIKNENDGEKYYRLQRLRMDSNDRIFVVMEEKTGYIGGNCPKLLLELMVDRGIKSFDYDNNTMELLEYLSRLEALDKGWY